MMMRVHKGFTLLELLVYLMLLAMLTLMVMSFAGRTTCFVLKRLRDHHCAVRMALTGDLVRRDIQRASPSPAGWNAGHALFKQLTLDEDGKPVERWIGYEVRNMHGVTPGLYRREGQWSGVWGDNSIALVQTQVKKFTVLPILSGDAIPVVVGASVHIVYAGDDAQPSSQEKSFSLVVALRSRVLP